jgi:glycosyltransferase involved in cell wall biosynthesis
MKVSCFSFLRNGEIYGYPFVESIKSALPLCDEFIIALGAGDDNTRKKVEQIGDPKIKIIDTVWNENQKRGGFVYAQQKMIAWYHCTGDWAFYLEGDEALHENDIEKIKAAMSENLDNPEIEVLAFHYIHFYGNPQTVALSPAWYRSEARIIKNSLRAIAMDGLHFTVMSKATSGRWPRGKKINASIYHYGYVRSIGKMIEKMSKVNKYWGSSGKFDAYGNIDPRSIGVFEGTHPSIMQNWIHNEAQQEFHLNPDYKISSREKKHRLVMRLEKLFRKDFSKRHWKSV